MMAQVSQEINQQKGKFGMDNGVIEARLRVERSPWFRPIDLSPVFMIISWEVETYFLEAPLLIVRQFL